MFKSRRGAEEPKAPPSPAESIEAMRRRARHRLIGAVVLVLIGVIGFPLLFDTQPRPVSIDVPIEIPDRNKVKPLPPMPAAGPAAPVAAGKVSPPAAAPVASAPAVAKAEPVKPAFSVVKAPETVTKAPEKTIEKAPEKPSTKADAKAEAKRETPDRPKPATAEPGDGAKALALLEGRPPEAAAGGAGRFVVQVGAYSDPAKAREARLKVERAGLKTYTHVAETKDGQRIRVRTGPYGSRAEADKAAEKIKGLDLPAAILSL